MVLSVGSVVIIQLILALLHWGFTVLAKYSEAHIVKEHEEGKKLTHLKINLENEIDGIIQSYSISEI